MKKKEKEELFENSVSQLNKELEKVEKSLVEAKFKLSKGHLQNVSLIGKLKNKIALIKTIISQKEGKNV